MSPLLRRFIDRHGLPIVDADSLDAFLDTVSGEKRYALLLLSGDGAQRAETGDVMVIFPELLAHFSPRLLGAVVAPEAEEKLRPRLLAYVSPSLVVLRGRDPVGVFPKVYDWAEYVHRIEAMLDPSAPALSGPKRPQVEITFSRGA
jgi:hydrogenase-1 operon protein HyaE